MNCPRCDVDAESLRRRAALVDELASLLSEYIDVDMGTGIRSRAVEVLARVGTWQLPLAPAAPTPHPPTAVQPDPEEST